METVYLKVSISSGVLCVDAASKYFFFIFQQLSVIFVKVKKSQHADLQCNSYLTSDLLIFREQREREKQACEPMLGVGGWGYCLVISKKAVSFRSLPVHKYQFSKET